MNRLICFIGFSLLVSGSTQAQWEMQNSGTTASLRGIDHVGGGVAWASGTGGTVLKTEDGGKHWQVCAVPPGAETLDFRGVQAFDAKTAIVMSSGKGDLSRLYKTSDGCATWKLVFTNPDKDGFWDAVKFVAGDEIVILGDSVHGRHALWEWSGEDTDGPPVLAKLDKTAADGESSFAASNTVLELPVFPQLDASSKFDIRWASATPQHAYMNMRPVICHCRNQAKFERIEVPLRTGATSGIFSFTFRNALVGIAVGGDFELPSDTKMTAAYSLDGGLSWSGSSVTPHGYRSAVAYLLTAKAWITVGPNGTDISFDDGKNWKPLTPGAGEAPGVDKDWNALSLPFVVGPKGRIGVLRDGVLK